MKKIKKILTIVFLLLTTIIVSLFIGFSMKKIKEREYFRALERQMYIDYDEYQDGDDIVENTDENVKFSAFFLQDINKDGIAEKYYGSCKSLSEKDVLYMDIVVNSEGSFINGKVSIESNNFMLSAAFPADNELSKNYITNDLKEFEFSDIINGMSKLLYGETLPRKSTSDTNYYSNSDNKVILTGTYIDKEGNSHDVRKEIPLTVDYYGTTTTRLDSTNKEYTNLDSLRHEETGSLNLTMNFRTLETKKELIINKNHIEGTLPQLNGYDPISVEMASSGSTLNYNAATRKFIIEKNAEVDSNGKLTKPCYNGTITSNSYYYNDYSVIVLYPIEAYESMSDIEKKRIKLDIPVEEYYECFNNNADEFESLKKSNVATGTFHFEYYQKENTQTVYSKFVDMNIGYYVSDPYYDYIIPKRKGLRLYNGSTLPSNQDYFNVYWRFYSGTYGSDDTIILKETKDTDENKKYDEFIRKTDGTAISMQGMDSNVGVFFLSYGPTKYNGNFLKENGTVKIYDDDNDILLATLDNAELKKYKNQSSMLKFDSPVDHIRVEIENYYADSDLYIYSVKELYNENIFDSFTMEDFLDFYRIKSSLVAYGNGTLFGDTYGTALYPEQFSRANLSFTFNTISTQFTAENQVITITTTSENSYSNRLGWHDGYFLIKVPDEILDLKINGISLTNNNMQIQSYEYYENEQGKFIKVIAKNTTNEPQVYSIQIDTDITVDPTIATSNVDFVLYSYNDEGTLYSPETADIYDVNNNLKTDDKVNISTKAMRLLSPNTIITNQKLTEFDKFGSEVVTPQIADVSPTYSDVDTEQNTAKISVQIKNNYSMICTDMIILGALPFEGNKDILKGTDLGSQFTTSLDSEGIQLPEKFKDIAEVYYSTEDAPTRDLEDNANNWKKLEDVEDITNIKTYMIILNDATLGVGELQAFTYKIKLPSDVPLESISYSQHAVYYSLITDNGKYESAIECNKMGIKIAQKYNLGLSKYKMYQNELLKGATYKVEEVIGDGVFGESRTAVSDDLGRIIYNGLYAGRTYRLTEIKAPNGYDLREDYVDFKADINSDHQLVVEYTGDVRGAFNVSQNKDENDFYNIDVLLEDEILANITLIKKEKDSDLKLRNAKYLLTGKNYEDGKILTTDELGTAHLTGLSIGQEYRLEEISAPTGYYPNVDPILFKLKNNFGDYEIEYINGDVYSSNIEEIELVPTLTIEVEDEKIPTFNLNIVKREKDTENVIPDVKFFLYYNNKKIGEYTTDGEGKIRIENLYQYETKKGIEQKFILREMVFPEGYAKVKDIEFYLKNDGNSLQFITESNSVKNISVEGTEVDIVIEDPKSFKLTKVDGETGEILPGTKFAFYDISDGEKNATPAKDTKGNIVGTKEIIDGQEYYITETDERGEISVTFAEGKYKAVEVKAADEKYEISKDNIYKFGIGAGSSGSSEYEDGTFLGRRTSSANVFALRWTDDGGLVILCDNSIVKLDESSEVTWRTAVSRNGGDVETFKGNYYAAIDTSINKYDENGNFIKTQKLGGEIRHSLSTDGNYLYCADNKNIYKLDENLTIVKVVNGGVSHSLKWINGKVFAGNNSGRILVLNEDLEIEKTINIETATINGIFGTSDGGFGIAGYTGSSWTSSSKAIVCKFNSSYNLEWSKKFTGNNKVWFQRAAEKDGVLYCGGATDANVYCDGNLIGNKQGSSFNYLYAEIDLDGNIIYAAVNPGHINAVDTSPYGIALGGPAGSNITLKDVTIPYASSSSGFIYQLFQNTVKEQYEILAENNRKTFSITTEVEYFENEKGGSISGEAFNPYESVKYGDNSIEEIKITPNDMFEILDITINGEEYLFEPEANDTYTMPQFENVTEDKHVVVRFVRKDNKITINKVDKYSREPIPGIGFRLEQLEERTEPNKDEIIKPLSGTSYSYNYINYNDLRNDLLGNRFLTNQTYPVLDTGTNRTDLFGQVSNENATVYEEPDFENEINGKTREKVDFGEEYTETQFGENVNDKIEEMVDDSVPVSTINYIETRNDLIGEKVNVGQYYFVYNDDNYLVPNIGATYRASQGITETFHGPATAKSYFKIELENEEGYYQLIANAKVSSENADIGYATIRPNTSNVTVDTTDGQFLKIFGEIDNKDYTSGYMKGGQNYYLHIGYYKDTNDNGGEDQIVFNSLDLKKANVLSYPFEYRDGKYYSTNANAANTAATSYIPIDLTEYNENEKFKVYVNAEISAGAGDYGYLTINESQSRVLSSTASGRFCRITSTQEAKDYESVELSGGKKYYLHMGYEKNASGDGQTDEFIINSINVYRTEKRSYGFEENNGKFISTNTGLDSRTAYAYVPIDLTSYGENEKFVVIANAEIDSENNDYGFLTINEDNTTRVTSSATGRFFYRSGEVEPKDYSSATLVGGKTYYLHMGYIKNASVSEGSDTFTINSVKVYREKDAKYTFVDDGTGALIPTNIGIDGKTARAVIPINLEGLDGQRFSLKVTYSMNTEMGNDYGYAHLLETTVPNNYSNSSGRLFSNSGVVNNASVTEELDGGKVYYLHLNYLKNDSTSADNESFVIENIELNPINNVKYGFNEEGGHLVSNNTGKPNTYAREYIPIDLTGVSGKYKLVINAEVSSQLNNDYGYAIVTDTLNEEIEYYYSANDSRIIYISGNVGARDYTSSKFLEGGNIYYLNIGYYKNGSTDSYNDNFTINSINLYSTYDESYTFEEDTEGRYVSNNQGKPNTNACAYIPIDLTDYTGKYELSINYDIHSQTNNDYGFANITSNESIVEFSNSSNRWFVDSGDKINQTQTKILQAGQMYYLHIGYYKNVSADAYTDEFIINSIDIKLSDIDLYSTTVTTNSQGKALTQIPFGKYKVTEINTVDDYLPLKEPVIIEFRDGENHEFTIENEKKAEVIVHHYLKDRDGNYTTEKVKEDTSVKGKVGTNYMTMPDFGLENYDLEKIDGVYVIPNNATGTYAPDPIEVIYYYEERPVNLTVHHYIENTLTKVPLQDGSEAADEVYQLDKGSNYSTSAVSDDVLSKEYELVEVPENAEGVIEGNLEVTYFYKKAVREVIINKVDKEDNTPLEGAVFSLGQDQIDYFSQRVDVKETYETISDENYNEKIGEKTNNTKQNYIADLNSLYSEISSGLEADNRYGNYHFEEKDGKFVSDSNTASGNSALSYIPIDLTNEDENTILKLVVNAEIDSEYGSGYLNLTTDRDNYTETLFCEVHGKREAEDYVSEVDLQGGRIYYLYMEYYKNRDSDTSIYSDSFTINSVKLYNSQECGVGFDKVDEKYISNNNEYNNTLASMYFPIDLTGMEGNYQIVVNFDICGGYNDLAYFEITDTPQIMEYYNNCYSSYSGEPEATTFEDYSYYLEGGEVYYLNIGFFNSINYNQKETPDYLTINSIDLHKVVEKEVAFEEVDGKLMSNNAGIMYSNAYCYIPIDLTNYRMTDTIPITINAEVSGIEDSNSIITITDSQDNPRWYDASSSLLNIVGYKEAENYETYLQGGKVYYVHMKYSRGYGMANGVKDGLVINSIIVGSNLVTDENGKLKIRLEAGEYNLAEITAPDGYELNEEIVNFKIDRDTDKVELTVQDERIKGNLIVHHYLEGTSEKITRIDGSVVEDEERRGYLGDIYATQARNDVSEKYNFSRVEGKPSGNYINGTIEVTYYYTLKPYSYTVEYYYEDKIDDSKTDVIDSVYGTVIDSYTDKIIDGYVFEKDENNPLTVSHLEDQNVIRVYYVKKADLEYKVNYIDLDTGENIIDSKVVKNIKNETVINSEDEIVEFENYNFKHADRDQLIVGTNIEENVINLYYSKKPSQVTVHHYLEGTTERLADDDIITADLNEEYHAVPSPDISEDYELANDPINKDGVITSDPIEVIFYYKLKDAEVIVNYYDIITNEKIAEEEIIEGKVRDPYEAEQKEIEDYTYVEDSGNKQGNMTVDPIYVNIYYKHNAEVIVNYIYRAEDGTEELIETKTEPGLEGDVITTSPEDFDGYILVERPEKETVTMTVEPIVLNYYYVKVSEGVIEKHIDENTNEVLYEELHVGKEGDPYDIPPKEFKGYELVEEKIPDNSKGTMEDHLIEVKYYYSQKTATVDEAHIDIYTNEPIEEKHHTGKEGDPYDISPKEFDGYDLVEDKLPNNNKGEMTAEPIVVNYYYTRKAEVISEYVDYYTGEKITEDVIDKGHYGDSYKTEEKTIDDYKIVLEDYPTNTEGEMNKDVIRVTYKYVHTAKVTEIHYDELTNKVLYEETHDGYVGDEYDIDSREFKGYKVNEAKLPNNNKGTMTLEPIVVKYYYRQKGSVIEKHIVETTNEILKYDIHEGFVGDDYFISGKNFDGYELIRDKYPTNTQGQMKIEPDEVVFWYRKKAKVIAKYIDIDTGKEISVEITKEGYLKEEYSTKEKSIDGYDLVMEKYPTNSNGYMDQDVTYVTYYYKNNRTEPAKNTPVVVRIEDNTPKQTTIREEIVNKSNGDVITKYNPVQNEIVEKPIERVRNVPDTELNVNRLFYVVSAIATFLGIYIIRKIKKKNK